MTSHLSRLHLPLTSGTKKVYILLKISIFGTLLHVYIVMDMVRTALAPGPYLILMLFKSLLFSPFPSLSFFYNYVSLLFRTK